MACSRCSISPISTSAPASSAISYSACCNCRDFSSASIRACARVASSADSSSVRAVASQASRAAGSKGPPSRATSDSRASSASCQASESVSGSLPSDPASTSASSSRRAGPACITGSIRKWLPRVASRQPTASCAVAGSSARSATTARSSGVRGPAAATGACGALSTVPAGLMHPRRPPHGASIARRRDGLRPITPAGPPGRWSKA